MGSELILSMLSAAAQEESLSISKNLKWSYPKAAEIPVILSPAARRLVTILKDNQLIPDPEEVPIVQYNFLIVILVARVQLKLQERLMKRKTEPKEMQDGIMG